MNGFVIDANDLDLLAAFRSGLRGLEVTRREKNCVDSRASPRPAVGPRAEDVEESIHLGPVADNVTAAVERANEPFSS